MSSDRINSLLDGSGWPSQLSTATDSTNETQHTQHTASLLQPRDEYEYSRSPRWQQEAARSHPTHQSVGEGLENGFAHTHEQSHAHAYHAWASAEAAADANHITPPPRRPHEPMHTRSYRPPSNQTNRQHHQVTGPPTLPTAPMQEQQPQQQRHPRLHAGDPTGDGAYSRGSRGINGTPAENGVSDTTVHNNSSSSSSSSSGNTTNYSVRRGGADETGSTTLSLGAWHMSRFQDIAAESPPHYLGVHSPEVILSSKTAAGNTRLTAPHNATTPTPANSNKHSTSQGRADGDAYRGGRQWQPLSRDRYAPVSGFGTEVVLSSNTSSSSKGLRTTHTTATATSGKPMTHTQQQQQQQQQRRQQDEEGEAQEGTRLPRYMYGATHHLTPLSSSSSTRPWRRHSGGSMHARAAGGLSPTSATNTTNTAESSPSRPHTTSSSTPPPLPTTDMASASPRARRLSPLAPGERSSAFSAIKQHNGSDNGGGGDGDAQSCGSRDLSTSQQQHQPRRQHQGETERGLPAVDASQYTPIQQHKHQQQQQQRKRRDKQASTKPQQETGAGRLRLHELLNTPAVAVQEDSPSQQQRDEEAADEESGSAAAALRCSSAPGNAFFCDPRVSGNRGSGGDRASEHDGGGDEEVVEHDEDEDMSIGDSLAGTRVNTPRGSQGAVNEESDNIAALKPFRVSKILPSRRRTWSRNTTTTTTTAHVDAAAAAAADDAADAADGTGGDGSGDSKETGPSNTQGWKDRKAVSDPHLHNRIPARKPSGWLRLRNLRNISTMFGGKAFKDNPVISFVSRQLHKYLISVEDEIEEATGTTKPGAVLFADASGFTAMTQLLARKPNGAEELSRIINNFFSRLLRIVDAFGGDVVKFSGDALSIVWFVDEEESKRTDGYVAPTLAVATIRACACAHELHTKLDQYLAIKATDTEPAVRLRLHMGIGAGRLTSVHVGGIFKRWEYILAGPPMTQIAIAEPLAQPGETVISPEAAELAGKTIQCKSTIGELSDRNERPHVSDDKHRSFIRVDEVRHIDIPKDYVYRLPVNEQVNRLMRRYIPKAVLQCLDENQPPQSEMRNVSVIFVNIHGLKLEVSHVDGDPMMEVPQHRVDKVIDKAQMLMLEIQRNVYIWEGSINKLMVDDKGLLVLCAMGLPPMPHFDDPIRAVAAALDLRDNIALLSDRIGVNIHATVGVSTGRAFCGVVGSRLRREYTLMGDVVNLAARLMCTTQDSAVVIDPTTHHRCQDIYRDRFDFEPIRELRLKGIDHPITAYRVQRSVTVAPTTQASLSDISGREEEQERLGKMVNCLIERHGGTLVLTGARGSGKSQLVKELQRQGQKRELIVFHVTKGQRGGENVLVDRHVAKNTTTFHIARDKLPVIVFGAWHAVFSKLIETVAGTVEEQIDWIEDTLQRKNCEHPVALLRHVLPPAYMDELVRRNDDTHTRTELTMKETVDAILEMAYLCIVRFSQRNATMIILHLQTGTALKVHVDPESWQLAMKLSEHCIRRRHETTHAPSLLLCVVTRPLSKVSDHMIKSIWRNASSDETFMELEPLSEMARLRYAAQVLSQLSNQTVSQAALPPELVVFLDERAAGNPKHISETLRECMKTDALGSEGPAIRVTENGRIECRDLQRVRVPDKIIAIVNQEFVQLSPAHQALLKAVCVHRSFTEAMAQAMIGLSRKRDPSFEYKGNLHEDLNELVKLYVLKRVPTNVYTTSYFPPDLFSQTLRCYAFASKVMQQEVSKLMMEHTYGHLRSEVSGRISTIIGAVVKLQALFRRMALRKKARECDQRAVNAAVVIQTAFRAYLRRIREHERKTSGNLHPTSSSLPSRRESYGILHSQSEDEPLSPDGPNRVPTQDFVAFIPSEDGDLERIVVRRGIGRRLPPTPRLPTTDA